MSSMLSACVLVAVMCGSSQGFSWDDNLRTNGKHFPVPEAMKNPDWIKLAQEELKAALEMKPNNNVARNVIMFLGDGMGLPTVWASRVYQGQYKHGVSGDEGALEFETFPHVGLSKVYSVDHQIPDSAVTGTAYLCGQKTRYGTIGMDQFVDRRNCSDQDKHRITSILDWSHDEGKWGGVISTARVTHASPAASYAHSAERYWESDADFLKESKGGPENIKYGCSDIARQLVEENADIHVILGGGRGKFTPKTMPDPEYPQKMGTRLDGRDLIQEWQDKQASMGRSHRYVWNKEQFDQVDTGTNDYLLGLFEPSHMQYDIDRDHSMEPSLSDLVEKAVRTLSRGPNGYFLFVEAARIDHAHHDGIARKALDETVALSDAVKRARELTNSADTLIVVTADHSLSFTSQGYTQRGNDILGIVDTDLEIEPASDGLPMLTLTYGGGGPGGLNHTARRNVTNDKTDDPNYMQQSLWKSIYVPHAGEDVPIYADGPMAHLFHGVHEQSYIPHVMAYASCVGPNKEHCDPASWPRTPMPCRGTTVTGLFSVVFITLITAIVNLF